MSTTPCACDLRTKLVGDGCETCNPVRAGASGTRFGVAMSDDYTRGFDDACAIYTQAALDMARVLAEMAAALNAERVLARRRALRLRWRYDARDKGDWSPQRHNVTYGEGSLHASWPGDLLNWRRVVSYLDGRLFLPKEWRVRGFGHEFNRKRRPIAGPVGRLP